MSGMNEQCSDCDVVLTEREECVKCILVGVMGDIVPEQDELIRKMGDEISGLRAELNDLRREVYAELGIAGLGAGAGKEAMKYATEMRKLLREAQRG